MESGVLHIGPICFVLLEIVFFQYLGKVPMQSYASKATIFLFLNRVSKITIYLLVTGFP